LPIPSKVQRAGKQYRRRTIQIPRWKDGMDKRPAQCMIEVMATRHVIWDWNGTLLDDAWLCVEILNGMLRRRGLPEVDETSYRDCFGFPVENVYRAMGFDMSEGSFEKMSVEYISEYQARRDECRLHEGARGILGALKAAGIGQSILSAYRQDMLDSMVAKMGLSLYFDRLAGNSNIYAASKVAYGKRLVADIGCRPDEIVMVGDTDHDFEVARTLGIACILVSCGHNSPARLEKLGVAVFPCLAAAAQHLLPGLSPRVCNDGQAIPA